MNPEMENSMNSAGKPESEFSIECFQMYTASEIFAQGLAGIVNQSDVEAVIRAQKQMLMRFEKTNEMLLNCNALSASRLKIASEDFKKHTKQLQEMKKDLDYIFRKIRNIKTKLSTQYPTSFAEAKTKINIPDEAEEEQEVPSSSSVSAIAAVDKPMVKDTLLVLQKSSIEKRKSNKNKITYVQMEQSPDGRSGKTSPSPMNLQRRSLLSNSSSTENSSSDTG